MRYFALVFLVGCAPQVVLPPVAAPPPAATTVEAFAASLPPAPPEPPRDPDPPPAANEQTRVLDSLFPKHLDSYAKCKKPKKEPETTVEIDDAVLKNLDSGQFIPVVEVRERVRTQDSEGFEIRYVVRMVTCQSVESPLMIEAFFTEYSLTPGSPADWRRPRATRYREWWETPEPRYVPRMGGGMD